jgi:release factor glutamine methyltransferase
MSNHQVGGGGQQWNVWGVTRLVYDFLDKKSDDLGKGMGEPDQDRARHDGDGYGHKNGLWAKAKGIVQHQYALTPLSWACGLGEYHMQGRAITPDDFAWLWRFPHVEHAPLSRLLGYGWFCGRRYDLNASTLDPRWESEGLIDIVCARWGMDGSKQEGNGGQNKPWDGHSLPALGPRILDMGTGSGCLLIELLLYYPCALGWGVDISADALHMARKNASRHGVDQRVRWMAGDGANVLMGGCSDGVFSSNEPPSHRTSGDDFSDDGGMENKTAHSTLLGFDAFDIIISNPPYVPTGYVAPKNVALWDPDAALYAGGDGLDYYRSWIDLMVQRLAPGGIMVLEIGYDQGGAVFHLCQNAGLSHIHVLPDLDGKDRYVWGCL